MRKHLLIAGVAAASCLTPLAAFAAPTLQQISPTPTTYVLGFGNDFTQGEGTIADVTAALWAVDLMLPPGPVASSSTSGCEAADFAGFAAGSIALLQRGTCEFNTKVLNAAAAGAVGALIFNEGQSGRTDAIGVTLSPNPPASIPWFFLSFEVGNELANGVLSGSTGRTVRMMTDSTGSVSAPVPEPASWAIMLLGFGAIGWSMRRNAQQARFRPA